MTTESVEELYQKVGCLKHDVDWLARDFEKIDAEYEDNRIYVAACETAMALSIARDALQRAYNAERNIVRHTK